MKWIRVGGVRVDASLVVAFAGYRQSDVERPERIGILLRGGRYDSGWHLIATFADESKRNEALQTLDEAMMDERDPYRSEK